MSWFYLPEGYKKIREINLAGNRRLSIALNLWALGGAVALLLTFAAVWPDRIARAYAVLPGGLIALVLCAAVLAYMFAHELTHGAFIKKYCGKKAHYGFKILYASAGRRDAYFDRRSYVVITLAPAVVWGALFCALCAAVPDEWTWPCFCLLAINLSGAAGDYYVAYITLKTPGAVVNDSGLRMDFYVKPEPGRVAVKQD